MRIEPYRSIGDVEFGMNETQVLAVMGEPQRRFINTYSEVELCYAEEVYRVDEARGLVECSGHWALLEIGPHQVPGDRLAPFLREQDPAVVFVVGFVVSERLGIAADTDDEGWNTIFTRGRWDKFLKG